MDAQYRALLRRRLRTLAGLAAGLGALFGTGVLLGWW